MKPRVLVIGGYDGIGKAVVDHFAPASMSVSRRNGYDLVDDEARKKIVTMSLDYDIVLSHAHTGHFAGQTKIIYELFEAWREAGKTGTLFNTGSHATYDSGNDYKRYAIIKHGADVACRQVAKAVQTGMVRFRITNLRVGTLQKDGIAAASFISTMEFIHELPAHISVPEIVLQPGPHF